MPAAPGEMSPLYSRTLERGDAWLRHYLMEGKPDSAAALLRDGASTAPRDALLRRLQLGLVLHRAGKYAESNQAFEWAEQEADRRYGRSVTQTAGSLVINDRVVSYVPSRPEMAMIPYYRMLNYLALGSRDEALVEARKAGAYLERLGRKGEAPCVGDGFVLYFTGLVQQSAGERGDALVSFRQAERAFDACGGRDGAAAPAELGEDLFRTARAVGVGEVADSARRRYGLKVLPAEPGPGTGELVLLVEHGWVAHRTETDLEFPLYPTDLSYLDDDDDDHRDARLWTAAGDVTTRLSAQVAAATAANVSSGSSRAGRWPAPGPGGPHRQSHRDFTDGVDDFYLLRLAWPELRLESCSAPGVRVVVADSLDGPVVSEAPVVGDVSGGVARAFAGARAGMVTRMVARGLTRYMMVRGVEDKVEEKSGRFAGWLAGALTNFAGNAMERADTRSWSLLPDRVSVVRFALPAGEHPVRIEVLGEDGSVAGTVDLGRVTIPAGGTVFRSERVWGRAMRELPPELPAPAAEAAPDTVGKAVPDTAAKTPGSGSR
jgi:tetratricopeptide (TPR) repeat protein